MIYTNDLKKGTRIKLANGWYGTLTDSRKGNTREAEVEGLYTEVGSVYGHDIVQALVPVEAKRGTGGKEWMAVFHTPAQVKARKLNSDMFAFHYTDKTEAGINGEG